MRGRGISGCAALGLRVVSKPWKLNAAIFQGLENILARVPRLGKIGR
jgi:hypothetical protein